MGKTKELIMFENMLSEFSDPVVPEHADEVAIKGVSLSFIEIAQRSFDNFCKAENCDKNECCSTDVALSE